MIIFDQRWITDINLFNNLPETNEYYLFYYSIEEIVKGEASEKIEELTLNEI